MKVYVKNIGGYSGVFSGFRFNKGDSVYILPIRDISDKPTRTSIKIGEGKHVEDSLIGIYINHNCEPSCEIRGNLVVARRDVRRFEEITFNYLISEDKLAHPFVCGCCGKNIK
mgnify:CR=1 FL=1